MHKKGAEKDALGLAAGAWKEAFQHTKVEKERLEHAKGDRGRATSIGNFLGRNINRAVSIEVNDRTGRATLRQKQGRSGKNYITSKSYGTKNSQPRQANRWKTPPPTTNHNWPVTAHQRQPI